MWQVDPLLDGLTKSLNVAALRQAVHSTNIANAGVSDYQRLEVRFSAEVDQARGAAGLPPSLERVSSTEPQVVASADPVVQLDQEVAQMSKNAIRYQALLGAFERTMSLMRYAAREGREG